MYLAVAGWLLAAGGSSHSKTDVAAGSTFVLFAEDNVKSIQQTFRLVHSSTYLMSLYLCIYRDVSCNHHKFILKKDFTYYSWTMLMFSTQSWHLYSKTGDYYIICSLLFLFKNISKKDRFGYQTQNDQEILLGTNTNFQNNLISSETLTLNPHFTVLYFKGWGGGHFSGSFLN